METSYKDVMTRENLDHMITDCRSMIGQLGSHGSFRLRTLLQMVLLELKKERAARARRDSPP